MPVPSVTVTFVRNGRTCRPFAPQTDHEEDEKKHALVDCWLVWNGVELKWLVQMCAAFAPLPLTVKGGWRTAAASTGVSLKTPLAGDARKRTRIRPHLLALCSLLRPGPDAWDSSPLSPARGSNSERGKPTLPWIPQNLSLSLSLSVCERTIVEGKETWGFVSRPRRATCVLPEFRPSKRTQARHSRWLEMYPQFSQFPVCGTEERTGEEPRQQMDGHSSTPPQQ